MSADGFAAHITSPQRSIKTHHIVRVELHSASEADYLKLHSEMEKLGFYRYLLSNGTKLQLPTAEYSIFSTLSVTAIKNFAKGAANSTGKGSWILAVQVAAIDWDLPAIR